MDEDIGIFDAHLIFRNFQSGDAVNLQHVGSTHSNEWDASGDDDEIITFC